MPDDPNVAAVLYGPIVLAGDLGSEGLTTPVRYGPSVPPLGKLRTPAIPAFVGDPSRGARVDRAGARPAADVPHEGSRAAARRDARARSSRRRISATPSTGSSSRRPGGRSGRPRSLPPRASGRSSSATPIDVVDVSSEQSERDHGYQGQGTSEGFLEGRKWRDARDGWFSYELNARRAGPGLARLHVPRERGATARARHSRGWREDRHRDDVLPPDRDVRHHLRAARGAR